MSMQKYAKLNRVQTSTYSTLLSIQKLSSQIEDCITNPIPFREFILIFKNTLNNISLLQGEIKPLDIVRLYNYIIDSVDIDGRSNYAITPKFLNYFQSDLIDLIKEQIEILDYELEQFETMDSKLEQSLISKTLKKGNE